MEYKSWHCGSVTQLHSRAPDLADDISKWVVANRKGNYMPFGTLACGATTATEFERYWKLATAQRYTNQQKELDK